MIFSVIVPTYNRVFSLKRTLESLFCQDFSDFEIIVVDDGSDDGTDVYLKTLEQQGKIQYIRQPRRGPAAARTNGLRRATGQFVAFTDDDCVVPFNWLSHLYLTFQSTEADIVGGRVINAVEGNIYSQVSDDIINHFVQYLNRNGQSSPFLTSNNIAYCGEAIRREGGFDERFRFAGAEERALNYKILMSGHRSLYVPDIVVEHHHAMTLGAFLRQQGNYGRGSYLLYRVAGKQYGRALRPMSVFAYGALLSRCFQGSLFASLSKLGLVLLSQLMVLTGFISEGLRFKRSRSAEVSGRDAAA